MVTDVFILGRVGIVLPHARSLQHVSSATAMLTTSGSANKEELGFMLLEDAGLS